MHDNMQSYIQELITRNPGIFTDDDFKECQEAVTDITAMISNLEASMFKFRRKLTNAAEAEEPDKEKIIYLRGLVDGMGLAIRPLENHYGPVNQV
ncbi:hypothetical protein [Paenibacillus xerothermodurans]|uniref:Uncharacterized protein n=1 Tax=Paenibacillus xerothermodurans TaxID=1977292 RepID=A0A2W1NCP7_PAEXE|nr:hypothetical protein [Paenibacillus xerothermodurans]PZE22267.1 hypothetical protein CBW46_000245 [Paenibacillus xerothermodurans]